MLLHFFVSLSHGSFLRMLNAASAAIIFGSEFIEGFKISLPRCKWQTDMVLFLNIAQPVDFFAFPPSLYL